MNLNKKDFDWAVNEGLINQEQADNLWSAFQTLYPEEDSNRPRFNGVNVAYYFGALIVISAMGWFVNLAWENFGGTGIFLIASLYGFLFALTGKNLYFQKNLKIPGGLLFTMAVCMTPLAIYGLQRATNSWFVDDPGIYQDFYRWVRGGWFPMEVGTIITASITLYFVRFPFLTAPIAFCLWYMSMDIVPLIYGQNNYYSYSHLVSFWFGLICLIIAYFVDLKIKRRKGDFAFWLYLFGLITFWFSLPFTEEFNWHKYCLINLILIFLSIILKRRVFIIFGGLGFFGYLGYLAYDIFQNSTLFPFALSALGIAIIYLGVMYQRYYPKLDSVLEQIIPDKIRQLLPGD